MFIILMGVAGTGKTTVGRLLAKELGWRFYEGDDFHPPANVEKMRRGEPLTDRDRRPWLDALRAVIQGALEKNDNGIMACSALKRSYRARLRVSEQVVFAYLAAAPDVIRRRLEKRTGHFMNPSLLESQFAALETPQKGTLGGQVLQCYNPAKSDDALLFRTPRRFGRASGRQTAYRENRSPSESVEGQVLRCDNAVTG